MTAILNNIILGLALLLFGGIVWTVCELVAKAFLRWRKTRQIKRIWAKYGYRDVQP